MFAPSVALCEMCYMCVPVESKARTYYGQVGSEQPTAWQQGCAEPGKPGRRRNGSPRNQLPLVPSKASSKPVLNDSSEKRTGEILIKPRVKKIAVEWRLKSRSSAGRRPFFVPLLLPVYRRLFVFGNSFHLSGPKPGHTTGGSGRGARRGGGAGPGRTGRRQNNTPRRQSSLLPPKASMKCLPNVSPEARTSEILLVQSKTRTHHGPVGSGRRTAGRRGGAELNKTGRRWVDPARRQPSLLPSSESRTRS